MGYQWTSGDALSSDRLNRTGGFGGNGADGALDTSGGAVDIDLGSARYVEKNYTSINIVTNNLTFSNPHSDGTIVVIRCGGDAVISASIVADNGASGGAGGTGGTDSVASTNGSDGNDSVEILDTSNHFGAGGNRGVASSSAGASVSGPSAFTLTAQGILYTIADEDLHRKMLLVVPGAAGGGGGAGAAGQSGADDGDGGDGGDGGQGGDKNGSPGASTGGCGGGGGAGASAFQGGGGGGGAGDTDDGAGGAYIGSGGSGGAEGSAGSSGTSATNAGSTGERGGAAGGGGGGCGGEAVIVQNTFF